MRVALCLVVLLFIPQDTPKKSVIAIKGARVYTIVGPTAFIDDAVILIEGARIKAVGKKLAVPADATTLDFTGKVIIPGLVDAGSGLFLSAGDPSTGGSPEQDVADGLDFFVEDDAKESIAAGVTTVYVGPQSKGTIHGLGAAVRVSGHGEARARIIKQGVALHLAIGVATGETSATVGRYADYKALKSAFEAAKLYRESWDKYQRDIEEYDKKKKEWDDKKKTPSPSPSPSSEPPKAPQDPPPAPTASPSASPAAEVEPKKPTKPRKDRASELLVRCMDEKSPLPVRIEVHQADAILNALKLADEFKLKATLEQCTEGWKVADAVAKAKVPVAVGPVFQYGLPRVDYLNHSIETAAALVKAGVDVSIGTFPIPAAGHAGAGSGRFLLESAALASSKGLTREQALRAVTFLPARQLGLEGLVGSVGPGRMADLVVLSGEPFEAGTRIEKVFVGGEAAWSAPEAPAWPAAAKGPDRAATKDATGEKPILLRGARIIAMAGEDLPTGCVLISNGRIIAVDAKIEPPTGATIIDLPAGSVLVPGFIDLHSHLASSFEMDENTEPVTPHVKALEAFSSMHRDTKKSVASGVTLVALSPGDGNVVGGRPALIRLNGERLDKMIWSDSFGLKFAVGDESLRDDREPTSRAGAIQMLREVLGRPDIRKALKERPAFIHANLADDITRVAQLGIKAILVHGEQSGRVIDVLKKSGMGVAFGPLMTSDAREKLETPARLVRAGIPMALISDAPATGEDHLRVGAAFAIRYGLPPREALKALTIVPATLLGIEKEFGTIEAGKAADLAVYTSDPLSLSSDIHLVMVEGRIVHQKPKK